MGGVVIWLGMVFGVWFCGSLGGVVCFGSCFVWGGGCSVWFLHHQKREGRRVKRGK